MGRPALSEEEKAIRAAQKLATKRPYIKKNQSTQTSATMENNANATPEQKTEPVEQTVNNASTTNDIVTNENKNIEETNVVKPATTVTEPANDFTPDETFKPLGGNKTARTYSRPVINPALQNTVIPEPIISSESLSADQTQKIIEQSQQSSTKPTPAIGSVEGFNELSPSDQKLASEQTADMLLGIYDKIHFLGRKFVEVDMDDLQDDHRKNELNINAEVFENDADPTGPGITIKQYFQEFNAQVGREFVVSDEFKAKAKPPLVRVCLKRGWGLSDEMYLGYLFAEDLAMKAGLMIGFKKLTNKYMTEFKEDHQKIQARVKAEVQKQLEEEKAIQAAAAEEIQKNNKEDKKA